MSIEEQIKLIKDHQNNQMVHPLTCGKDSRHALLEPLFQEGKVILVCPTCRLIQAVPDLPLNPSFPGFDITSNE